MVSPVPSGSSPQMRPADLSGAAARAQGAADDIFAEAAVEAKAAGIERAASQPGFGREVLPNPKPDRSQPGYIGARAYYEMLNKGNLAARESELSVELARSLDLIKNGSIAEAEKHWQKFSESALESIPDPEIKAAMGIVVGRGTAKIQTAAQAFTSTAAQNAVDRAKIDEAATAGRGVTLENWQAKDGILASSIESLVAQGQGDGALAKAKRQIRADMVKRVEGQLQQWAFQGARQNLPWSHFEKQLRSYSGGIDILDQDAFVAAGRKHYLQERVEYLTIVQLEADASQGRAKARIELLDVAKSMPEMVKLAAEQGQSLADLKKMVGGVITAHTSAESSALSAAQAQYKANDAKQKQDALLFNKQVFDGVNSGGGLLASEDRAAVMVKNAAQYGDENELARSLAVYAASKKDEGGRSRILVSGIDALRAGATDAELDDLFYKQIVGSPEFGRLTAPMKQKAAVHLRGFLRNNEMEGNNARIEQGADAERVDENIKVLLSSEDANARHLALAEIRGTRFSRNQAQGMRLAHDNTDDPVLKMGIKEAFYEGGGGGLAGWENIISAGRYMQLPSLPKWDGDGGISGDYMDALEKGYTGMLAGIYSWASWEARRQFGIKSETGTAGGDDNINKRRVSLLIEKGVTIDPLTGVASLPLVRGREDADVLDSKLLRDGGYVAVIMDAGDGKTGTVDPATTHTENGTLLELMDSGVFAYDAIDEQDGKFQWQVVYRQTRAPFVLNGEPVFVAVDKRVHTGSYMPDPEMPDRVYPPPYHQPMSWRR